MTGVVLAPGTSPALAQTLLHASSILNVVPAGSSVLDARVGIDWQQWASVSPTMLDSKFMSQDFGLGQQLDTYL